jgi:hypothetical protein
MIRDRATRSYPGYRNHLNWEKLYQSLVREHDVPVLTLAVVHAYLDTNW